MKFEQYIPCRRFVKHLAGAARQRALGRCSSDDGGARAPAGLGRDGRKRGRAGIGRGSLNGRRVARSAAAVRLDGGWELRASARESSARERAQQISGARLRFGPRAGLRMPRARFLRARWSSYSGCARAKKGDFTVRR